jgi:hypothetical protein
MFRLSPSTGFREENLLCPLALPLHPNTSLVLHSYLVRAHTAIPNNPNPLIRLLHTSHIPGGGIHIHPSPSPEIHQTRTTEHSSRTQPRRVNLSPFTLLPTLLPRAKLHLLHFQANPNSFRKTPGVACLLGCSPLLQPSLLVPCVLYLPYVLFLLSSAHTSASAGSRLAIPSMSKSQ